MSSPASRPDHSSVSPTPHIPWIIAIATVVGAVALAAWATTLQSNLADTEQRVSELTAERDQLRESAAAAVFDLTPTAQGPGNASGTLYLTASGSGVLSAVNLPEPSDGEAYQVWYLPPDEGEPIPGGMFSVDDRGVGFMLVSADVGAIRGVSISLEAEDGTTEPSGPMLLSGAASGARG